MDSIDFENAAAPLAAALGLRTSDWSVGNDCTGKTIRTTEFTVLTGAKDVRAAFSPEFAAKFVPAAVALTAERDNCSTEDVQWDLDYYTANAHQYAAPEWVKSIRCAMTLLGATEACEWAGELLVLRTMAASA